MRSRILQRGIRPRTLMATAAVLLCALVAGGCSGVSADNVTKIEGHRVDVTVTLNSARTLLVRHSLPITTGMTALQALQGVAQVSLDARGNVAQVNGKGGGTQGPMGPVQAEWTYRINGVEPSVPPGAFTLRPGMSVWWDLRRVDILGRIPVAVGNFPEPLMDGYRDDVRPLDITYGSGFYGDAEEFAKLFDKVNPEVIQLQRQPTINLHAGPKGTQLIPHVAVRPDRANFVIGRWEDIELDPYIQDIATDPRKYGLTVWIEGHDIWRQDPDQDLPQELPQADGIVFATTIDGQPDSPLVFVVTGVTDAGVKAAAHALHSGALQYYLAGAVNGEGAVIP